jgi:hypothetical protein
VIFCVLALQNVAKISFIICSSQAVRDHRTAAALAMDLEDDEMLLGEGAAWVAQASEFWKAAAQDTTAESDKRVAKRFRAGAYEWLLAADSMLKAAAGLHLTDFMVTAEAFEATARPENWPCITFCTDQGSDGWSALWFLQSHLSINCLVLNDPLHRSWNDCQLALKGSGLWSFILVTSKVFSLDVGPWQDAKWFQEAKEAVQTYVRGVGSASDPLFQELYSRILLDMGMMDSLGVEDMEQYIFDTIPDALAIKSQRVAMSRWFGWVDSAKKMIPLWHRRLLIYLYISISQGWVKPGSAAEFINHAVKAQTSNDTGVNETRTARDLPEFQQMRSKCKNGLHLATSIMVDPDVYYMVRSIVGLLQPCWAEHGNTSSTLHDVCSSAEWFCKQARGEAFTPIRQVAELLNSPSFWEGAGLWVQGSPLTADVASIDGPGVVFSNAMVGQLGKLAFSLMLQRWRSCVMYTQGLPLKFAALLSPSGSGEVLDYMKRLDAAWNNGVHEAGGWFWRLLRHKSPMRLAFVKQVPPQWHATWQRDVFPIQGCLFWQGVHLWGCCGPGDVLN